MNTQRATVDRRSFLWNTIRFGTGVLFVGRYPNSFAYSERPSSIAEQSEEASEIAKWEVAGRYVDACRCNVPCPCHFGTGSDYDTCDATSVYQIENGRYEDVRLDGLLAIVVLSDTQRIYLDEKANHRQRNALAEITRALTGSFLLAGVELSEDLKIEVFPIKASLSKEQAVVHIPGVLDIKSESLTGGDGKGQIEMRNLDLGPGWMESVWAGRSSVYTHQNGERWDHSGRNSYFGRFSASSNMPSIHAVTNARRA